MFDWFMSFFSPKVRGRAIVHGVRKENIHFVQNAVQSWNIPGRMGLLGANSLDIELEGRQSTLRAHFADLGRNPHIQGGSNSIEITWLPFTGKYGHFSAIF